MSKFKFKQYNRYDEARAKAGVDYTPVDNREQRRGTFRVSLCDFYSKFVRVEIDRVSRENKAELDKLAGAEERDTFLFCNLFLHDWSDVLDDADEQVPFSAEAAYELLSQDEWLSAKLQVFSKDEDNFQHDPRATKDAEAKN